MLEQSFILLDRISSEGERRIWEQGIPDWDAFREARKISGIGPVRKAYYERRLQECAAALRRGDYPALARLLPQGERWRLYPFLQEEALYLDIETAERYGDITVLGAWDGSRYSSFVKGCNLEKGLVKAFLSHYRLFVTFNGSSFDLPIIERYFGGVLPEGHVHVDLRHLCARLGLHGGLKAIERILGIAREEGLEGMDGAEAAMLWWEYLATGDEEHVELLLEYNEADCRNLEPLARWAVEALWRRLRKH